MSERMSGQLDVRLAERPEEQTAPLPVIDVIDRPRRSKARLAVIALFAVVIAIAVAIPLISQNVGPSSKPTHSHSASKTSTKHKKKNANEIDAIDPDKTTGADARELKNKLIAGGTAFVLVVAVVGGRRIRKHNASKREG